MPSDHEAEEAAGTVRTVVETPEGRLVQFVDPSGIGRLIFLARTRSDAESESARLRELAGPGIPSPRTLPHDGADAIEFEGLSGALPLSAVAPAPDRTLRAGVVTLMSALSSAHGRGYTHGRLDADHLLVTPDGRFWTWGWGGACGGRRRRIARTDVDGVVEDLRAVGATLLGVLGGAAPEIPVAGIMDPAVADRGAARIRRTDAELARVLLRLVAPDPRESCADAGEVLRDLGESDLSLPDAWTDLPFVARHRIVARIVSHAAAAPGAARCAEVTGPPRSGRSRVLVEVARLARSRGIDVIESRGTTGGAPWGAIGEIARQLVARLPREHALRSSPAVDALLGRPSEIGDAASAVFAELVESVEHPCGTLVLLDDADSLPVVARVAWSGAVRLLSRTSRSARGGATIVASSIDASPPDAGVALDRLPLREFTRRHVIALVAGAITERARAVALAGEIVETVGTHPGDVVDYLRALVEAGALVANGRRLAFRAPVSRPAFTCVSSSAPIEGGGRDGRALAEVLAVAWPRRISRELAAEVAEVAPHRLAAAADAAIRLGILAREGTDWCVRTMSLRNRILRAIPDDRRRGLHRELLQRALAAATPDWPEIARHGRGCGDPRAAEWTRRAIAVLRSERRLAEAIEQYEDARLLLDASELDLELRIDQADTFCESGRLADGIRVIEEVLADPRITKRQRARATLIYAWLLRFDQRFTKLLEVPVPEDSEDGLSLGRLRLLRSTALAFLSQSALAEREIRLARAEASPDDRATVVWKIAEREAEFLLALMVSGSAAAARLGLAAARFARRHGDRGAFFRALYMVMNGVTGESAYDIQIRIALHAERLLRSPGPAHPVYMAWFQIGHMHMLQHIHKTAQARLLMTSAYHHAGIASEGGLRRNFRVGLLAAAWLRDGPRSSTAIERAQFLADVRARDRDLLSVQGRRVAGLLLSMGCVAALLELGLSPPTTRSDQTRIRFAVRTALVQVGRSPLPDHPRPDAPIRELIEFARADDALWMHRYARKPGATTPVECTEFTLMAHYARSHQVFGETWPAEWGRDPVTFAAMDGVYWYDLRDEFLYSLVIRGMPPAFHDVWLDACRQVRQRPLLHRELLRWRHALAHRRMALADCRVRAALDWAQRAERAVEVLRAPEVGAFGPAAYDDARRTLADLGVTTRRTVASFAIPTRPAEDEAAAAGSLWCRELAALRGQRRAIVSLAGPFEAAVFGHRLAGHGLAESLRAAARRSEVCEVGPNLCVVSSFLAEGTIRPGLSEAVERARADGARMILVTDRPVADLVTSAGYAALAGPFDGHLSAVPRTGERNDGRREVVAEVLAAVDPRHREVDAEILDRMAAYRWPGGLLEIVRVCESLCDASDERITVDALLGTGWEQRTADEAWAPDHRLDVAVEDIVRKSPWLRSSEIAAKLDASGRTVVRALARLVESRRLARVGRGRAVRYGVPGSERSAASR